MGAKKIVGRKGTTIGATATRMTIGVTVPEATTNPTATATTPTNIAAATAPTTMTGAATIPTITGPTAAVTMTVIAMGGLSKDGVVVCKGFCQQVSSKKRRRLKTRR